MNLHVHIERLVLDGLPVTRARVAHVRDALERELRVLGELLEHRSIVARADSLVEPLDVGTEELLAKRLRPSPTRGRRSPTGRRR